MNIIQNPILRGFNPDPSIVRVGDDYYIATSTFEWFPGVQIHHSKDLIHWKLIAHPLNRISQLNMMGNPSSGGIWAPCLTYNNGTFFLVYTDTKSLNGGFKDTPNFLVTTKDILGDWSDPIFLNSSGFDPSLFHDEDGRKWLVNMMFDYRKDKKRFGGILLQEYSYEDQKLVGPVYNIFKGTELGSTEGPHLYKYNGWYYLLTAEGGTGLKHAVTIARSRNITGPYEVEPQNPILTSRFDSSLYLQKAGHADIVETQNGEWYMVHLCGRPIPDIGRCILGRETAIQKIKWTDDGWLKLEAGGNKPLTEVPAPVLPEHPWEKESVRDDFDTPQLSIHFSSYRLPLGQDSMSLSERPGFMRLKGRDSLSSHFHQSLVARRQQSFCYTASTCIEFEPEVFMQSAGLICLYDTQTYYYLKVTWDEELGKCLSVAACDNSAYDDSVSGLIPVKDWKRCFLKAMVDYERLQFFYSKDEITWQKIGPVLDASKLSDEYSEYGRFTGAFVGLCCQDLSGQRMHADFDWFEYIERTVE